MITLHLRAVYLRSVATQAWARVEECIEAWEGQLGALDWSGDNELTARAGRILAAVEADACLGRDMIRRAVDWGA